MGLIFFGATLLLSLIAIDASAAELVVLHCPLNHFGRCRQVPADNGLKATMQLEVRQGGAEALRAAFEAYATSHGLRFRTLGYGAQTRDRPLTIVAETTLQGVVIKIEVQEGLALPKLRSTRSVTPMKSGKPIGATSRTSWPRTTIES